MVFEKVLAILGSVGNLVEVANRCDKAYAEGAGHPDWYSPYGTEKPEKVAQNLAGLQAVISGVGVIGCVRSERATFEEVLGDVADDKLTTSERSIMLRLANATWGAGQSFRTDKGPLGRATNMNVFDLLDADEVDKDYCQIKAAALFLKEKLA